MKQIRLSAMLGALALPSMVVISPSTHAQEPPAAASELPAPDQIPEVERRDNPLSPTDREIQFTFAKAPWEHVIRWFSDISGLALQMEIKPTGTFNYVLDPQKYTLYEALDILNEDLKNQGHYIVKKGNYLKVIALEDGGGIPPSLIPRVAAEQLELRGRSEFVSVLLSVNNYLAENAAKDIEHLKGEAGQVIALGNVNKLLVTDRVGNIMMMKQLLDEIDSGTNIGSTQSRYFQLKYALARDVDVVVRGQLGLPPQDEQASASAQASSRSRGGSTDFREQMRNMFMSRFGGGGGGQSPFGGGSSGGDRNSGRGGDRGSSERGGTPAAPAASSINTSVDDRTNTIFVNAPNDKLAVVENIIKQMDIPSGPEQEPFDPSQQARVAIPYRLADGDAESLTAALQLIYQKMPSVAFSPDRNNNAVIAVASREEHRRIAELVGEFERDERDLAVIALRVLDATSVEEILNGLYSSGETDFRGRAVPRAGQPKVQADLIQNRVLVRGSTKQIADIRAMLVQMGESAAMATEDFDRNLIVLPAPQNAAALISSVKQAFGSRVQIVEPGKTTQEPRSFQLPQRSPDATLPESGAPRNPESIPDETSEDPPAEKTSEKKSGGFSNFSQNAVNLTLTSLILQDPAEKPADPAASNNDQEQGNQPDPTGDVKIAIVGDRIIVQSENPVLLKQVVNFLNDVGSMGASSGPGFTIFRLNSSDATQMASTLNDILGLTSTSFFGGTTSSGPLKIIPDTRTNSLIVSGPQGEIARVKELLDALEGSQGVNQPWIIPVQYTSASQIAEVVKGVYAQRMAAANQGGNQGGGFRGFGGQRSNSTPEFGTLTVTADSLTNSIIVSCSETMYREIRDLVGTLDVAAGSTEKSVKIVTINTTSPSSVQTALSGLLGKTVTPAQGESPRQSGQGNNDNQQAPTFRGGGSPFGGFNRGGGGGVPTFGGFGRGGGNTGGGFPGFGGFGGGGRSGRGR